MNKSRIPKRLKIGGFNYKVQYPYTFDNDFKKLATHEWNQKKIKVADTYLGSARSWTKTTESLLHEIVHALDHCQCNRVMEEDEVLLFSTHLFMVLRDNDIQFSKNVIPSTIRIAGHDIAILYPYEFVDGEICTGNLDDEGLEMKLSDRNGKTDQFSPQTVMSNLLYLIMCAIGDLTCTPKGFLHSLSSDPEVGANVLSNLSNGLYQTIVDNDLEKLFKSDGEMK